MNTNNSPSDSFEDVVFEDDEDVEEVDQDDLDAALALAKLHYQRALADICGGYLALNPPNRIRISDSAADILMIQQPGAPGGKWSADETPYMVVPMDTLASREHEAVIFVGPARTGKTQALLLGWLAHAVVNDPGDMLMIQMTKDAARGFAKTDVDRAIRYSDKIHDMKSTRAVDTNTFDVMFRHGMWLRIVWPTITNVSSSTYRYVAITDLDRMDNAEDVDGEGPLFKLARKRTQTFMSRGMTLAESSPGIPVTDHTWTPATKHEAPPVTGILGLYNTGDRRRWYWQCPHCAQHFEAAPGMALFDLPDDDTLLDGIREMDIPSMAKEYGSRIIPPCCKQPISSKLKNSLNAQGRWLGENQWVDDDGVTQGLLSESVVASFWIGGVAATYQTWKSLVETHLTALQIYALTGSEESLKNTVTGDQGLPYTSRHLIEARANAGKPEDRANQGQPRYVVPDWTRCVICAVDVQGGAKARFEVQVHAIGPFGEQHLVDRFQIKNSMREGMGDDFAPLDPAGYAEDWDVLTVKLLRATWKTPTDHLEIKAKLVVVDTGGEGKQNGGQGVSHNAYAWFRRVRALRLAGNVMLYKGGSHPGAPVIKLSTVGKRNPEDTGDIPLYVCNPNLLSDQVAAGLRRKTPGPGFYHFPQARHAVRNPDGWLPQAFFDELSAEVRDLKTGIWTQVKKSNETFDLCRMIMAGMLRLGIDKIKDWSTIGEKIKWLAPLGENELIMTQSDRRDMKENELLQQVESKTPVPVPRQVKPRRAVQSSYLGR